MYGAWDAPLELQQSLLDEDDPPPIENVSPPDFVISGNDDPDTAFRSSSAYAAQVMAFDASWQSLLDAIDASDSQWLVILIGARGFPLGEHRRIGGIDSRVYAEQLHVPWLIRFPDGRSRLVRSSALTTHLDVMPTLLDWLDEGTPRTSSPFDGLSALPLAESSPSVSRNALLSAGDEGRFCLRTPHWCLHDSLPHEQAAKSTETNENASELFVRPDDRWEANDVSKLCPETVEELRGAASAVLRNLSNDAPLPHNILPSDANAAGS
jgi:arylsulfatase A-like enzyme